MRAKLSLNLDDLIVDSFDTSATEKTRGTVFGEQQCTCPTACSCPGCLTCDASCNGTCDASCNGTCGGTCDNSCYGTCDYSCDCNSNYPCPTPAYTNCGRYLCY